jgi:hypothetical protein
MLGASDRSPTPEQLATLLRAMADMLDPPGGI